MKVSYLKLAFWVALVPAAAHASGRQMAFTALANINTILYVNISNPSTVPQTINVTFRSTGTFVVKATSHTGGAAMTCVTTPKPFCELKNLPSLRVMAPGESLVAAIEVDGSGGYSSTNPASGVIGQIDVVQDDGYLIAGGVTSVAGSTNAYLINGGRPF